jgi:hypothetical protein
MNYNLQFIVMKHNNAINIIFFIIAINESAHQLNTLCAITKKTCTTARYTIGKLNIALQVIKNRSCSMNQLIS